MGGVAGLSVSERSEVEGPEIRRGPPLVRSPFWSVPSTSRVQCTCVPVVKVSRLWPYRGQLFGAGSRNVRVYGIQWDRRRTPSRHPRTPTGRGSTRVHTTLGVSPGFRGVHVDLEDVDTASDLWHEGSSSGDLRRTETGRRNRRTSTRLFKGTWVTGLSLN